MAEIRSKKKEILLFLGISVLLGCITTFSILIFLDHQNVLQNYNTVYAKITGYDVANKECVECSMECFAEPLWGSCARDCISYPYAASAYIQYFVDDIKYESSTTSICERYEEEALKFLEREYPSDHPLFIYYLKSDPTKWYTSITFKYTGYIVGIVLCFLGVLLLSGALIYNLRSTQGYEGIPAA
jgi:hypothetical protein